MATATATRYGKYINRGSFKDSLMADQTPTTRSKTFKDRARLAEQRHIDLNKRYEDTFERPSPIPRIASPACIDRTGKQIHHPAIEIQSEDEAIILDSIRTNQEELFHCLVEDPTIIPPITVFLSDREFAQVTGTMATVPPLTTDKTEPNAYGKNIPHYTCTQGALRLAVWKSQRNRKNGKGTFDSFGFKLTKSYLSKYPDGQPRKWEKYTAKGKDGWSENSAPHPMLDGKNMWRDTTMFDVRAIPELIPLLQKTFDDHKARFPGLGTRYGARGGFQDGWGGGPTVGPVGPTTFSGAVPHIARIPQSMWEDSHSMASPYKV